MRIFLEGEDSRGDHGLGSLVEFRFKAPPGTTSSSITTHTSSGQRNCALWASQPQKSVTLLPCLEGRTTKSTKGHVVALGAKYRPIFPLGSRQLSWYSNPLRAGRYGDRIPMGARFSTSVQTGPEAHLASCKTGTGSVSGGGGRAAGAWRLHPPQFSPEVKERVELYFYSPSGLS